MGESANFTPETLDDAGALSLRSELRKYFCDLTLDPNSAHRKLKLSDNNNKTVTFVKEEQPYPDHQDRFEDCAQILCSTCLSRSLLLGGGVERTGLYFSVLQRDQEERDQ
ncbi:hypothetical protein NL108_014188 [Boleophthalmus pectinirostris]|nr:hypothetical protein NL108_014188 [Boleophthalmus pectinirostris]